MYDEVRPRGNPLPVDWNNGSMTGPINGANWMPLHQRCLDPTNMGQTLSIRTARSCTVPAIQTIAPGTYVPRGAELFVSGDHAAGWQAFS